MLTKEQKDKISEKYIGKTYNYLTIIERDDNYKKEHNIKSNASYYKCQCKCGNFKTVRITTIVAGEVKSCGCLKKEQDKINLVHGYNFQDLTGKKYGKLTVLHRADNIYNDVFWTCKCDCGTIKDIRGTILRAGQSASCGCLKMSVGEYKIGCILKENNINFKFDSEYFKDLILPSGRIARYDFILFNQENKPYRLIEFDGEQHQNKVQFFNGEEGYLKTQTSDKLKNEYAKSHNIPLIRIPYSEINNLSLDLLMSDIYLVGNV